MVLLSWQSKIPGNPLLVATLNSCSMLAKCPWTWLLTEIFSCLFSNSCFCSACLGSFCLLLVFLCCRYITSLVPWILRPEWMMRDQIQSSFRSIKNEARDVRLEEPACSWHLSPMWCIKCQLGEISLGDGRWAAEEGKAILLSPLRRTLFISPLAPCSVPVFRKLHLIWRLNLASYSIPLQNLAMPLQQIGKSSHRSKNHYGSCIQASDVT